MLNARLSVGGFWGLLIILIFSIVIFEASDAEASGKNTSGAEKKNAVSAKTKRKAVKAKAKANSKTKRKKAKKRIASERSGIQKAPNLVNPYSFFEFEGKMCAVDLVYGLSCIDDRGGFDQIEIDEDFRLPAAAAAWGGKLYICDYRNNRLVIYDTKKEQVVRKITHEMLSDPEGIFIDDKGTIYVASYGNGYVLKFTSDGDYSGKLDYKFTHPHGLYFYKGLLYVTELQGDKRVVVIDREGNTVKEFGNSGPSKLRYPTGIWVNGEDILVSDAETHSIKIYDIATYDLKKEIGGIISFSEEGLYYPYAVARKNGKTYIADTHNNRIKVLGPDGKVSMMIIGERLYTPDSLVALAKRNPKDGTEIPSVLTKVSARIQKPNTFVFEDKTSFSIKGVAFNGYEYVWNVKKLKGDIYAAFIESGTLHMIDMERQNSVVLTLTSFQFDPLEPLEGYAYRFQDGDYDGSSLYIANTLPGNILKVDPITGSIEEIIALRKGSAANKDDDKAERTVFRPKRMEFIDGERLAVLDAFGRLFVIDLKNGAVQKTKQVFSRPKNLLKTEDYLLVVEKDRVHIYNKKFDYFGWIGFQGAISASQGKALRIAGLDKEISVAPSRLKPKKGSGLELFGAIEKTGKLEVKSESAFMKAYDDMITEKTWKIFRFWKNQEGIVKYDFNFSWLNFDVPVEQGYGSREYVPFAAHYALLNYYDYKGRGEASSLNEFKKHAEYIMEKMECDDDTCEIFNELKLVNYDGGPFLSSITQSSAAAVMMKYYDLTGDRDYLETAQKLARVLEDKLKTSYKDRLVYRAYPEGVEKAPKTQDVFWDMIFLSECGEPCKKEFEALKQSYLSIRKEIEWPFLGKPIVSGNYDEANLRYSPFATKLYHRSIKGLVVN